MRISSLKLAPGRTVADDHLRAGQIEAQEGVEVLLHGHAPDIEEDGRCRIQHALVPRPEQGRIHAPGPAHDVPEAAPGEFSLEGGRADHHRACRPMEALERPIGPGFRDPRPGRDIFGEAGVIARGEGPALAGAGKARRQPDRPLGRDMDVGGSDLLQQASDGGLSHQGQADFRIGRHRKRAETLRRQEHDFRPEAGRLLSHVLQGAHHAVDLGTPCVACDQKTHQAALSPMAASTSVGEARVTCVVSAQRISSKDPS